MNVDAIVEERCAAIDRYIDSIWRGAGHDEAAARRWICAGRALNAALERA